MGTEKVYQGIVLDWPMIRQELLSGITDLFPEAQLIPIVTEERPHPERSMTVIPVVLDPGTVLANDLSFWTTIRIGLAVAWLAAIVALTAVALGGWSLIDLSERRIRFVSAVTHELRTPLTTLRLYLDMLTSGIVKEPQHRDEYLVTLHVEAERLHRLVDNVLDFARLEKHEPKINLQACSVQSLLDQLYQDWCGRCRTDGKELIAENHLLEGECLVTDQQLLCQLVGNLIDNARKYSRGAENPTIWLRIGRIDAHHVYVEVEDRGPGIATEDAKVIFRPFRRGSQADTIAGGVGLGLALAQRWVHLLRGTIRVQSGANRVGVCFRCELPTRFS